MSHRVKAIECVMDWNLWPRHAAQKLDSANLRQMKEALEAGLTLPPIIVDKGSMRVVDGFHRLTAILDAYHGHEEEAMIDAEVKDYESEKEMFCDAMKYNSSHGKSLSPLDRAYAIIKARKMKIPAPVIAQSLGMLTETMKEFMEKRTAIVESTGERIALPWGASHLSSAEHGEKLDDNQEHYARSATGTAPRALWRQMLACLKADAFKLTPEDVQLLKEIEEEISSLLKGVK